MSGTSQYLPWGTAGDANTQTYSAYAAQTTLITKGFQSGVAPSLQFNTLMRQVSVGVAALAKFAATDGALPANDDGDVDALMNAIRSAIDARIASQQFWSVGDMKLVWGSTVPAGFLLMNGADVSRTTYAALWAFLGSPDTGDHSTTFTLPQIGGEFLRVWDAGRGVDSGRTIRSAQAEMIGPHTHPSFRGVAPTNTSTGGTGGDNPYEGATGTNAGTENRPRNVAVMAVIKF